MSPEFPQTAELNLTTLYHTLGYNEGRLFSATDDFTAIDSDDWLEIGDWLLLAHDVGAKDIFFVENEPILVFYDFQHQPSPQEEQEVFRRVWCMARPKRLCMALPTELRIYSLDQPPAITIDEWQDRTRITIKTVAEISQILYNYTREQLETRRLAGDTFFGNTDQRADKQLISDLKKVRRGLMNQGLAMNYAHALIGRSIFIRYLEDRGVLTADYFAQIAHNNFEWQSILNQELEKPDFAPDTTQQLYVRVLRNKDFTNALFDHLAHDFNGDMFPRDQQEHDAIQQIHLNLLRAFLLGDINEGQPKLFFWAYDFKIIPIELISSIYEEFYHKDVDKDDNGTHYTPSVLVEFVLSQVLTKDVLSKTPKILDPACGSGIFLVEAFRRIVRYESLQKERDLYPNELRAILRNQLTGIEIYQEAARIAAFSLYLALLHYQNPPDILNNRLPNLLHSTQSNTNNHHYSTIICADSFSLTQSEHDQLKQKLVTRRRFDGRKNTENLVNNPAILPLESHSFDVIVGNPPWGEISSEPPLLWTKSFDWTIGDRELSQAFIARTLAFLKPHGHCGLLVSTGVLLNRKENSKKFRQHWLQTVTLKTVVNFDHLRHIFFTANAPFVFIHYRNIPSKPHNHFQYWSAKKVDVSIKQPTIVLSHTDINWVEQSDVLFNDYLWKVYWWGNHHDARLIKSLKMYESLGEIADERGWIIARGFDGSSQKLDISWLSNFRELPAKYFQRYGTITSNMLIDLPKKVSLLGHKNIYSGWRLLIGRGITQKDKANGRIEVRLENMPFAVRNSIHGINVDSSTEWERNILLGLLWSSLTRYYLFLTASSWGMWRYEIRQNELVDLPIRFPQNSYLSNEINNIVIQLQQSYKKSDESISDLEYKLDQVIFDLYQLTEAERDLIRDMCDYGLDFFYNAMQSEAVQPLEQYPEEQGIFAQLPSQRVEQRGLEGYLYAFLERWNQELEGLGEFRWQIVRPRGIPMIAIIFSTQEFGTPLPNISLSDDEMWQQALAQCSDVLRRPISQDIFIDGMVRVVTDTDIYIIKRDERRLWTRSASREDVEATLLQAIQLQERVQ